MVGANQIMDDSESNHRVVYELLVDMFQLFQPLI